MDGSLFLIFLRDSAFYGKLDAHVSQTILISNEISDLLFLLRNRLLIINIDIINDNAFLDIPLTPLHSRARMV